MRRHEGFAREVALIFGMAVLGFFALGVAAILVVKLAIWSFS